MDYMKIVRIFGLVITVLFFLGVCYWALASRNKQMFEEVGMLPLQDD